MKKDTALPEKNSLHKIEITDMNNLGSGIGRLNDFVVFVAGGCTGDLLEVRIIKAASSYLVARIEKILSPSPHRIASGCTSSKRCGGCVYRNISYAHELELKRGYVVSAMKKAGLTVEVNDVICDGRTDGYRNKAQYPVGKKLSGKISANKECVAVGFYAGKTHEIIPLGEDSCLLQPKIFGEIAEFLREWFERNKIIPYDEITNRGSVRHLYMRISETTGEVMVCIVLTSRCTWITEAARLLMERFPKIVSVYENINSDRTNVVLGREFKLANGEEKLRDELCGRIFEISPAAFWQVNRRAAELLYKKAAELAAHKPGERVLDLFCGIGTVGMSICEPDTELYGVEIVREAVRDARVNAELNGFSKAEYICCDASDPGAIEREIGRIADIGIDVVILDPPRKGCSPELLRLLAERTNARVVYVSCNPDTLARDMAIMQEYGYVYGTVTPVDMFPRTGHVETVVLMSRVEK